MIFVFPENIKVDVNIQNKLSHIYRIRKLEHSNFSVKHDTENK